MERPHPGQKAAVSGICAEQAEHHFWPDRVSSMERNISEVANGLQTVNKVSALTPRLIAAYVSCQFEFTQ
jgi:hypothetical protein